LAKRAYFNVHNDNKKKGEGLREISPVPHPTIVVINANFGNRL